VPCTSAGASQSTSSLPPNRGAPLATVFGWLSHLHSRPTGTLAWLTEQLGTPPEIERVPDSWVGQFYLPRSEFRCAGEALDVQDPGPLQIDFEHFQVFMGGPEAPAWDRFKRLDGSS
jgi:hypothetical protein